MCSGTLTVATIGLNTPVTGGANAGGVHATATAADLLLRCRAALANGDSALAQALAQSALEAHATAGQISAAELLLADSLLVAGRTIEAVSGYRAIMQRHPDAPEAERAAFAVGQLLSERGADVEAEQALGDYLAKYPTGLFVREARERLTRLQSAQ